jgi:hypothetical protein
MRFFKYSTTIAAVILLFCGWMFAQEGYYGQQAPESASAPQAQLAQAPPLTLEQQKPPEIRVTRTVAVGNLILQPGEYVLQYHKGAHHFIRVSQVVTEIDVHPEYSVNTYTEPVGDINCELAPLPGKAPKTLVSELARHGVTRITKLEIKGTSVEHLL